MFDTLIQSYDILYTILFLIYGTITIALSLEVRNISQKSLPSLS